MTSRNRAKQLQGVMSPKGAARPVGGRQDHALDGHWGRGKTIFDSELYRTLLAVIDDALHHANSTPLPTDAPDLEEIARGLGVTDAEWEALAMAGEGMSLRESADLIGISHVAVRKRLLRARGRVAEGLAS